MAEALAAEGARLALHGNRQWEELETWLAGHVSGQVVTVAGGMEGRVLWETGDVDAREVLERLGAED